MFRYTLVIGSGSSFHNVRAFSLEGPREGDPRNDAFQDWLIVVCTDVVSPQEREQRLIEWEKAPYARYCHPREEHLLSLHVCVGMIGKAGEVVIDDDIIGKRAVAFLWQLIKRTNLSSCDRRCFRCAISLCFRCRRLIAPIASDAKLGAGDLILLYMSLGQLNNSP